MKIELAYGKKGLEFEMPSQAKPVVIRKPPFEIPEDSFQVLSLIHISEPTRPC